jgi:hypothetical protein
MGGSIGLIESSRDGLNMTEPRKKELRIKFAKDILKNDLLPHVGIK